MQHVLHVFADGSSVERGAAVAVALVAVRTQHVRAGLAADAACLQHTHKIHNYI